MKINIKRKTGDIDPKIFGVFMEPIYFDPKKFNNTDMPSGNTMYGTFIHANDNQSRIIHNSEGKNK
jgi:hypothetical protein